ncbi:MAG TPA: FAD-dependent monooxygenase [Pseudolabrys sp.]|nr:FAD-dependent monooxygenase [Pseudolabrys sp.]
MAPARHVIIAGAGVAGLTAALALTRIGLRVTVLEQAAKLEETGAGIQIGPNAARVLIALGLRERLASSVMTPEAIRVMAGGSGREIVRIPLGGTAEGRYGAPYWTIHRGDLQAALADAVKATQDITLKLATCVEDFATHVNGLTVHARNAQGATEDLAFALIGADGVWSTLRGRLQARPQPKFRHRTAWRALIPAEQVAEVFRQPLVHLWLGPGGHLVHYPVKAGRLINIVAIVHDDWSKTGWSAAAERAEIMRHFGGFAWDNSARVLVALPERWLKWALYDRAEPFRGDSAPVTLIGDAAHPMLPFLAQGAGLAIEDAAVLAAMLADYGDDPADALRAYEGARWHRAYRAQQASRMQGRIYGMSGPEAFIRNVAMRAMGGERLLSRFDWLYSWRPPERFERMS